jgi:hypothetical protein
MRPETKQNESALVCAAQRRDKEALQLLLARNWFWLKYREPAEQALKDARKSPRTRRFEFRTDAPSLRTPFNWRSYLDRWRRPNPPAAPQPKPDDQPGKNDGFDKIQEQMRELQQRLDKLEKNQ